MHHNSAIQQQRINEIPDSYEKGRLFEDFIIKLFNEKKFKVRKYRASKKMIEGSILPYNHSYPDIEFVFLGKSKFFFAVECKWREKLTDGMITWAKDYQIKKYNHFRLWHNMPVFIAIGIGGTPCNPEKLYVTPLEKINDSPVVYESDLIPYTRKPTHRFFYDTAQLLLF